MPKRVLKSIIKRMPKAGFRMKKARKVGKYLAGGALAGAVTGAAVSPPGRRIESAKRGALLGTGGGFIGGALSGAMSRSRGAKLEIYQKRKKKKRR